jgi:opacity protein-like surface antigen
MKKWIPGLLVLALCAAPAAASSIGFFVSSYSPSDTDASEGVGFDLEFGSGPVEFEMRLSIYEELFSDANPKSFTIEAVPIDFGVNRSFAGGQKITPYAGGGITYYVLDFGVTTTTTTGEPRGQDIDPEIGYYAQVGFEFQINSNWKGSLEALYRQVDTNVEGDDLGLEVNQKVDLGGGAINFGVAVQW